MNNLLTDRIAGRSPRLGWRVRGCALLTIAALAVSVAPARAELQILITKGVTDPIPIAIVPFGRAVPADGGFDVAEGATLRSALSTWHAEVARARQNCAGRALTDTG